MNTSAQILRTNKRAILNSWEKEVRHISAETQFASKLILIDHLPELLDNFIEALETDMARARSGIEKAASIHGEHRAKVFDFSIEEALEEYEIFRKILFSYLEKEQDAFPVRDRDIIYQGINIALFKGAQEFNHYQVNQLKLSSDRLQMITDIQPLLISQLDKSFHFVFVNETYEHWFKLKRDQIIGAHMKDIVGEKVFNFVQPCLMQAFNGVKNTFEFLAEYSTGPRYVHCTYSPGFNESNDVESIYISVVDISEQRQMLEVLQEEAELRQKFITTLSHDLRTPLTAASMSAEVIARKTKDEKIISLSERVTENLKRANLMIEKLLDVTKIRSGKSISAEIRSFNFIELIDSTIQDMISIYGDRFLVHAPSEILVDLDPNGVQRILENLCSNAIKYGADNEKVLIDVSIRSYQVVLSVHNKRNPLIPLEREKLFLPFKRGSETAIAGKKGWGIGLTIVKGITEGMKGEIDVDSTEEGTTFKIILPLHLENEHREEPRVH